MKTLAILALLSFVGQPGRTDDQTVSAPRGHAPRGHYVEARTASVYAGACHYGAEATTAGREAVLVWHFEGGSRDGVDLSGVDVAAVILADENLAEPGVERRSLLFVSDRASEAARKAALAEIRAGHAELLGHVQSVEPVALGASFEGEGYRAEARGVFAIEGEVLPDRACCKMPYNVWYRPFERLSGALVGCNATFRFADKRTGRAWSRSDENTSWTGTFDLGPAPR